MQFSSSELQTYLQPVDGVDDTRKPMACHTQWRIQGAGGPCPPPVGGLKKNFWQYINIITKPTAYDGPWEY